MHVRALSPQDAEAYQRVRLLGHRDSPTAFASSYEEESSNPAVEVARRLEPKQDGAVFGAFEHSTLQGIIGVQRESLRKLAHKAYIWGMYVVPTAQRSGIGTLLIARAIQYAQAELAVRSVVLGVNTRNVAAVALYRKLGFTEYGLEKGSFLIDGVLHDEYLMVRSVPNAL
jgi:ribosomal protein S18 acetylase RimI-like enzyme